ncbi:Catechol 2,3-dioxygenase [Streptomyces prasinopilosus]|uniref:Catechol 2,3-dioxygenase n=2 Tax=Streptomyces prasinopilosus TaxID=67344 RepID=A0A1G7BK29_9ACTN|nr:Catechol 2,3-dioxygenase [Streptomyces prasinopilosus]
MSAGGAFPSGPFGRSRTGHLEPMTHDASRIRLVQTVLDSTDARELAEFYRSLLGLDYAEGDEPPPAGQPDEHGGDWLVLRNPDGGPQLAFQQVERLREPDWPDGPVPQQMHLDLSVASLEELRNQHERVLALGGSLLSDRDRPDPDDEERFRVYRDPEGHPFCIFVAERDEQPAGAP